MIITQVLDGATNLGKEIKISPKSAVLKSKEGCKIEFNEPSVMVKISVGDGEAVLLMSDVDFTSWRAGEAEARCPTFRQFQNEFLK